MTEAEAREAFERMIRKLEATEAALRRHMAEEHGRRLEVIEGGRRSEPDTM